MSMNGMDLGTGTAAPNVGGRDAAGDAAADAAGDAATDALVNARIGEAEAAPGFSLAQVAPRVPATGGRKAPLLDGRAVPAEFREAWRTLKYAVEQARERHGIRTLGVVSVGDGDGKSLTAVNLALALTENGARRVALLDADFEKPQIASLLAAEAPVGLAEVLAHKMSAERAMFASGVDGLFAMGAGNAEAAGVDPIDASERFGMLANRLATVFDFVIVDTPALAHRVDAAAIAGRLDACIVVVKARATTASEIDQALSKLGESRVLGLVLNDV